MDVLKKVASEELAILYWDTKFATLTKRKLIQCFRCGITFSTWYVMIEHEKSHHIYRCGKCYKWYPDTKGLFFHQKAHGIPYKPTISKLLSQCLQCGKMFSDSRRLIQHEKEVHYGKFNCRICGKKVKYRSTLRSHFTNCYQTN